MKKPEQAFEKRKFKKVYKRKSSDDVGKTDFLSYVMDLQLKIFFRQNNKKEKKC